MDAAIGCCTPAPTRSWEQDPVFGAPPTSKCNSTPPSARTGEAQAAAVSKSVRLPQARGHESLTGHVPRGRACGWCHLAAWLLIDVDCFGERRAGTCSSLSASFKRPVRASTSAFSAIIARWESHHQCNPIHKRRLAPPTQHEAVKVGIRSLYHSVVACHVDEFTLCLTLWFV